jgi:hypothetical protein
VSLRASASDVEAGPLPGSAIVWDVVLQHNSHQHFFDVLTGAEASFTPIRDHDADSFYLVTASVTDSDGLTTRREIRIDPETVPISIRTDPPGTGEVAYGSASRALPFSTNSVIGFETTIVAPATITAPDGRKLAFKSWDDFGGGLERKVIIGPQGLDWTARYEFDAQPPDTWIVKGPTPALSRTPVFQFDASEYLSKMECRIDSQPLVLCDYKWQTPRLGNGNHTVSVRGIDLAGNVDPTPATKSFVVFE